MSLIFLRVFTLLYLHQTNRELEEGRMLNRSLILIHIQVYYYLSSKRRSETKVETCCEELANLEDGKQYTHFIPFILLFIQVSTTKKFNFSSCYFNPAPFLPSLVERHSP